ncbi:MAG TPA: tRNA lysidine(34) synthetase TilS [Pseudomonadota bacterium]|nr:tRNA lysidine(34) synthetase TilS [Pseudomonadota bacterium]
MQIPDPDPEAAALCDSFDRTLLLRALQDSQVVRVMRKTLRQQQGLFVQNEGVLVACSGGPDSTALALAIRLIMIGTGWRVQVVYINHGLREEATDEALAVLSAFQRLDLSVKSIPVTLKKGSSLQASARQARYQALLDYAHEYSARWILTGHTRDDQAETVFQRLLGGAGLRGLSGIPAHRVILHKGQRVHVLRPLLSLDRSTVLEFVRIAQPFLSGLPVFDRSNEDERFLRSRIRYDHIPRLEKENPRFKERLASLATQCLEDSLLLDQLAQDHLRQLLEQSAANASDEPWVLDAGKLRALPKPILVRVFQILIPHALSARNIAGLLGIVNTSKGSVELDLPGGWLIERRYDAIYVFDKQRRPIEIDDSFLPVDIAETGAFRIGSGRLHVSLSGPPERIIGSNPFRAVVRLPAPGFPLQVRRLQPGDRMQLPCGRRKVSDVLIDMKVPAKKRANLFVVTYRESPIWIIGVRAGLFRRHQPEHMMQSVFLDYEADSPLTNR